MLAGAIAVLAVSSVRLDSATADEPAHIAAGVIKLRYGWLSFYPGEPPLMNVISALPLGAYPISSSWRSLRPGGHWTIGEEFLYRSGHPTDRMLLLARLPTIALFLVLCFVVDLFVTAETGSRFWGVIAFALTGFCPNLLAHGRLATVDLAVTAFSFFAFVLFLRLLRRPSVWNGIGAGVLTMAAILSKTSGAILIPYFALILAWHAWRHRQWRPLVVPCLAGAAAAVVTLEGVILGLASTEYLRAQFPESPRLFVPFLQLQQDALAIMRWYGGGTTHPQFLLGQFSHHGFLLYNFVAVVLKTPLGSLLLLCSAVGVALRRHASFALRAALLFVIVLLVASMPSQLALGLRYVLPIYPFMYAAVAIGAADLMARTKQRRLAGAAVALMIVWHLGSSVAAWPSYISYFNELIGSRRNADRFLIDSNLDWGADLRRLKLWADANGVDVIRLHYFGGGDPAHEFGNRAEVWTPQRNRPLPKGWFAVSRHFYRTSFDPDESPVDYDTYLAWSKARYVTTVGGSIDVYRVD